jgi:hypothetical protein
VREQIQPPIALDAHACRFAIAGKGCIEIIQLHTEALAAGASGVTR